MNNKIIEGNTLIADFMEWHFEPAFSNVNTTRHDRYITPHSPAWTTCEQMIFHSSWEWLMPVIVKISHIRIKWKNSNDIDTYYPRTFGMLQEDTNLPMFRFNGNAVYVGGTLIEAAWIAVVEFIKSKLSEPNAE